MLLPFAIALAYGAGVIVTWIWALGSAGLFLSSLTGCGKKHKTKSQTKQSNAYRVPFLLESQAHPGGEETGK